MAARDVDASIPGKGGNLSAVDDGGNPVKAIIVCGMQADGTVTPILVDSDGKVITTSS